MIESARKILIVGATGFIGGRLAERLFFEHGHHARCLFRDYSNLARLARLPVEMVQGDVLQPESLPKAAQGCDVYIFCVHGKEKDNSVNWRTNTEGLRNMLEVAVTNKVRHFIFLSTSAIYEEQFSEAVIDESIVPRCTKKDYAAGKLEGERICKAYSEQSGLPITILRPTIVYGPFAPSFTIYPAEIVRTGALKDYGGFGGICNPVYVDDVVDAIIASILNVKAFNEVFLVSSGETILWRDFFDAYSKAILGKSLERSTRVSYVLRAAPLRLLKEALKFGIRLAPGLARAVYEYLRSKGSADWSWVKGQDLSTISFSQYSKRLCYRVQKLKEGLGYIPKYSFTKGFAITEMWLGYQGYVQKN